MSSGSRHSLRLLTIDQGNSSAKVTLWEDSAPVSAMKSRSLAIEDMVPLLSGAGEIDGCVYCSVCHTDAKFLESLRRLVGGQLLVLTSSVDLPMEVNYGTRGTLGSDRVAAVAGAVSLFPGEALLVVDSGTALTVDATDTGGNFMGGNISPGIQMRFRALHEFTDRLPLVDDSGPVPPFGTDTPSAIRCGVVHGMVSEIADAFERARQMYGCSRVVMAGNGDRLICRLLRERGLNVDMSPDLVGRGLLSIFMHNLRKGNV